MFAIPPYSFSFESFLSILDLRGWMARGRVVRRSNELMQERFFSSSRIRLTEPFVGGQLRMSMIVISNSALQI